jgi:hypothetical protein
VITKHCLNRQTINQDTILTSTTQSLNNLSLSPKHLKICCLNTVPTHILRIPRAIQLAAAAISELVNNPLENMPVIKATCDFARCGAISGC